MGISSWLQASIATSIFNKDGLYPHTRETSELCLTIANHFVWGKTIEVVIAPAIGGVILSQWTAHYLSEISSNKVLSVYAEKTKDGETFIIGRGYDNLIIGKNVLVVEDVLTTGGSVKKVIEAVRALGGNIVGLGAICNRGRVTAEDVGGVPILYSMVNIKFDAWNEAECPLCANNVPINTNVGRGSEYLAKKRTD